MTMFLFLPLLVVVLPCSKGVVEAELKISNANDFKDFVSNVNGGSTYEGTTVLLGSDLSLPEINEPISNDPINYFRGTFDGQGHIISDLTINSSSYVYLGLFGYSTGLTIKNVVLDSSCSITNSYKGSIDDVYVGGIIGYCHASSNQCNIESGVSVASVTFDGDIGNADHTDDMYLGGIAGCICSCDYFAYLKNCANYGRITDTGSYAYNHIGGITGAIEADQQQKISNHMMNCVNYGQIIISGTSKVLASHFQYGMHIRSGGIVGESYYASVENCLSVGKITLSNTSLRYTGAIVGLDNTNTTLTNVYWTSNTGCNLMYGVSYGSITYINSDLTELNQTTQNTLKNYALQNSWANWVMLHLNGGSIGNFVDDAMIATGKYFPNPKIEGDTSMLWFKDADFTTIYDPTANDTNTTTELYAAWKTYSVTFVFGNGTEPNVRYFNYSGVIDYPDNPTMEGFVFNGWSEDLVKMPSRNVVITALWSANNYIVTFYANGGDALVKPTMVVSFNSTYGDLPTPKRESYVFLGWFTESNESVKNETIVAIPRNHTLYAQWKEATNQVEIVFNSKELSNEEIEEIIKQYTNEEFTIICIEKDESGDIKIIVGFEEVGKAEEFVRNVNEMNKTGTNKLISRAVLYYEVFSDSSPLLSNALSTFIALMLAAM